jgi:hypothetical protein
LFLGQNLYPPTQGEVRLLDTKTSKVLAAWTATATIQSFSLSPNGERLLVSVVNPSDTKDVLILNSLTGAVSRSFESGFDTHPSVGARLNAAYLDSDHFVLVPGGSFDARVEAHAHVMKVFESSTGKIADEFSFDKFNPSGDVWTSTRDVSKVAALSLSTSKLKAAFTEGGSTRAQLVRFRLGEKGPACLLGPLPEPKQRVKQSGIIRLSPNLESVGLLVGNQISVYAIPPCERNQ